MQLLSIEEDSVFTPMYFVTAIIIAFYILKRFAISVASLTAAMYVVISF